ncbi:MAG: glycoside hydrolase family 3 C-terminal domain-containing protein [Clostridia bacterium]|nr:glycoside hydrolase family 3 C-terminal domain-containing protein [Clostridia bacterium]
MNRDEARRLAHELVSQMTVEEKASQLRYDSPAIPRLGIPAYNWWNEALHGVARAGTATVFPQAIGLAAMFDEDMQEQIATVISTEARAKYNGQAAHEDRDIYKGLSMWSPNINIFRDPRWGRGHETYGEDPYLTTRLGVRFIRGLQGNGKYLRTAACAKHFAVHSGPEAIRHEFDAIATPKDMWETYLPAFEAAVKEANVEAFMGAYNRVNGEAACGSKTLLVDILRQKWGFEGHVTSDCWAIRDFHTRHMVTATAPESAALALKMGCDLNCGNTYLHMMQAYQEGLVTEEDITICCERMFTSRFLLGLFADDCEYDAIPFTACDTDEHDTLALAAAEKSMVLLRNNGVLPLDPAKVKTIAVVGPNANSIPALEGNYNGVSSRYVTFLEGVRAYAKEHGMRVMYSEGCHLFKDRVQNLGVENDRLAECAMVAEAADVVIACVGLDATLEGEEGDTGNAFASGDKLNLDLPESQQKMLDALVATGKPLVTVVAVGSALNIPQGDAEILAWYPGQAGGTALAEILFGEVSPSGKLPLTFYHGVDELPDFTDYNMTGRTYRYFTGKPLFPFGFGLSYTTFNVQDCAIDGETGWVTATVANTGDMDGETVVQVYVRDTQSQYETPNPHLAGFARVALASGEAKQIAIKLDKNAFTVVNDEGERIADGKSFDVYVGLSQPDALSCELMGQAPLHTVVTFE